MTVYGDRLFAYHHAARVVTGTAEPRNSEAEIARHRNERDTECSEQHQAPFLGSRLWFVHRVDTGTID